MPVPKWDDFTAWKAIAIVLKQLERGREGARGAEDANTIKLHFCVNEVPQHQYSLFLFVYTYREVHS